MGGGGPESIGEEGGIDQKFLKKRNKNYGEFGQIW